MGKTFLITGGAGFIGSNFVHHIFEKYPDSRIMVLDLLTYAGSVDNFPVLPSEINNRFEFYYGDVRNAILVDSLVQQADIVVHFAAETHVTRSIYDDVKFFETDIMGTQAIANSVLKHQNKVQRFIHISTSEVYGTSVGNQMNEDHPLNPSSPYASAKAGADRLVYSYVKTYDIPAVIIRPFNNYGPRQHLEKAIPRFITGCILGEKIPVHGSGESSRDWIYVGDTCEGIDAIINADLSITKGEVFNLGTNRDISVKEVAEKIVDNMHISRERIDFIHNRPGQVDKHLADINKVREKIGWQPKVSFEEGIVKTITWYRQNKHHWERQLWLRHVPITLKDGQVVIH